ncbi:MAG: hypothetical protein GX766_01150 [Firmicutes bacterium]|nr:hypothetical protein [Bacillota bacterium]HOB21716.1 hypothetical protein [Bacillota bacterium]HQD39121.1 hypothetical protein [Bacillota bacterium]
MRKLVAVAMACLLLFSISGCREPGLLGKLKGYKVGVTWEGEPSYSWLVSQEAKRRTRLAIVDDNSIPELADYQSSLELLGDKHKLDYVLVCSLAHAGPMEQKSNFSVLHGLRISVVYKRTAQVAYKLIAVPTGEILTSGIASGVGTYSTYLRFDGQRATGRLGPTDEEVLLVEAIRDAIRRSELL